MERRTGSARLTGSPADQGGDDELLRAVREAAAAEYDILGELGRGERGTIVYLARERASQKLVALKLRPDGASYDLNVDRELDAVAAALVNACPSCSTPIVAGARFCSHCGLDLTIAKPGDGSREAMLAAVHAAAIGEYDILGEMERADGGAPVYFARELKSARLVALRLTREVDADGREAYALGVAQILKPLVASLGARYATPSSAAQAATAPPPRSAAPSPHSPQPTARSKTPPSVIVPDDISVAPPPKPSKPLPVKALAIGGAALVLLASIAVVARPKHAATDTSPDTLETVVVPPAPVDAQPSVSAAQPAAALAEGDNGFVSIGSLPAAARVTVNGRMVSDRQFALPPGEYQLVAMAPGYRPVSTRVNVLTGQTITWVPKLSAVKLASAAARAAAPPNVTRAPATPNCLDAYGDKSWAAALVACTREANAGNQPAQRNLATMYDQGLGVAKNPAQAAVWYQKAASTGNRDASFQLATMYENGRGVPQNQKTAIDWYRKAALLGDADAQVKLGRSYTDGSGVTRDDGEAAAWFQRAADQGNLYAANRLGAMYVDGKGVAKDESKGAKLFQSAAAKSDAQGQFNLATLYAKGRGVQKSDSAANDLYVKSAKQGYADAIKEARRRNLKF